MQFLGRGIPFIVNTWMVRHVSVEDYAVTTLPFYLLFFVYSIYLYIFFCNCLSFDFLGIHIFPCRKIVEIFVGGCLNLVK